MIDADSGARLPGSRRLALRAQAQRDGVAVDAALLAEARALAGIPSPRSSRERVRVRGRRFRCGLFAAPHPGPLPIAKSDGEREKRVALSANRAAA